MRKVGKQFTLPPDDKELKKHPKTTRCIYIYMFKMKKIKLMIVFIYPQITNIPFPHHIFMENI